MFKQLITISIFIMMFALPCLGAPWVKLPASSAKYRVVGAGLTYTKPSEAAAAAVAGDVIVVLPGTYTDAKFVLPDGVNLIGTNKDSTVIQFPLEGSDAVDPLVKMSGNNLVAHLTILNLKTNTGTIQWPLADFATETSSVSIVHDCILYGPGDCMAVKGVGWCIIDSCRMYGEYDAILVRGKAVIQNNYIYGDWDSAYGTRSSAVVLTSEQYRDVYAYIVNNVIDMTTATETDLSFIRVNCYNLAQPGQGYGSCIGVSVNNRITLASSKGSGNTVLLYSRTGGQTFLGSFGDRVTLSQTGGGVKGCLWNYPEQADNTYVLCGDNTINDTFDDDDLGNWDVGTRVRGKVSLGPLGVFLGDDRTVPFVVFDDTNHNPVAGKTLSLSLLTDSTGHTFTSLTGRITEIGGGVYFARLFDGDFSGRDYGGSVIKVTGTGVDTQYIPTSSGGKLSGWQRRVSSGSTPTNKGEQN